MNFRTGIICGLALVAVCGVITSGCVSTGSGVDEPESEVEIIPAWQRLENWQQLKKGMAMSDVRGILGEPNSIVIGRWLTYWYYEPGNEGPRAIFGSDSLKLDVRQGLE